MVVGMKLGCLNHSFLTEQAILKSGAQLVGWYANSLQQEMDLFKENLRFLQEKLTCPLLDLVPSISNDEKNRFFGIQLRYNI